MMWHLFGSVPNKHVFLHLENKICRPGHLCCITVLWMPFVPHLTYNLANKTAASCYLDIALRHITIIFYHCPVLVTRQDASGCFSFQVADLLLVLQPTCFFVIHFYLNFKNFYFPCEPVCRDGGSSSSHRSRRHRSSHSREEGGDRDRERERKHRHKERHRSRSHSHRHKRKRCGF